MCGSVRVRVYVHMHGPSHNVKCMYYYFGGQGKKRFECLQHVILPCFITEIHLGLQARWPMAWDLDLVPGNQDHPNIYTTWDRSANNV